MAEEFKVHGYNLDQLRSMPQDQLRAILHERTHHTIEVLIYRILKGRLEPPRGFGLVAERLLGLWWERGLPLDAPDIEWCAQLVEAARAIREGRQPPLEPTPWESFTPEEAATVERLIRGRKSIRQFKPEPIPMELVRRVLEAGLWAPQGCNVGATRFLVLTSPQEQRLVSSDIPLENCVMVVVLQEMAMYQTLGFDKMVPQNIYYDAAAVADHICLMAHCLGLGSCWLTHGEETQRRLREHFNLSPTMTSRLHIVLGWPDEETVKSGRMGLDEALLN